MPYLVAYKFRGLQGYLRGAGRLRDVVGGSEIIDSLCRDALAEALTRLGLGKAGEGVPSLAKGDVLQAASGQILLSFEDDSDARRFVALWPLLAEQWAPGGRHAIALEAYETAEEAPAAVDRVLARVRTGPELPPFIAPMASPLTLRAQRTAAPVVAVAPPRQAGDEAEGRDASTLRRRQVSDPHGAGGLENLKERFGFAPQQPLSRDVDALAAAGGSSILAVVHGDGSGFGARFRKLMGRPDGPTVTAQFAAQVREIMQEAAGASVDGLRDVFTKEPDRHDRPVIACRPILLGGDDFTVVVPGPYGLQVGRRFLSALEDISAARLPAFAQSHGLPGDKWQRLHATVGIAYVHAHHPFSEALRLADTAAGWAKAGLRAVEDQTSGLVFHRAVDTATSDFEEIFADQVEVSGAAGRRELTAAPYVTRAVHGFHTIDTLLALRDAARPLSRGNWREVAALTRESDVVAKRRMDRIFEVLGQEDGAALHAALRAFGGTEATGQIWSDEPVARTPVHDIDVQLGLAQRFDDRATAMVEGGRHG